MAEAVVKVNSLRIRFERGHPEPTEMEVFHFMRTKMHLKGENLLSMYKEIRELSVIIKFTTEKDFKTALKNLPGTMDFDFNKYESVKVQLSSASAVVRYVRLFNLPPEVTDREIHDVMCQYGKVQSLVREKYGEETGFPIWTSVRGVYIEVKEGAEIPGTVQIRNLRARVYYEGLVNKCFLCNSSEHLKAECPNRKSINDRLRANSGASYSGALTGAWTKKKTEFRKDNGDMTNLNDMFPEIPKEKRKQADMEADSEAVPGTLDIQQTSGFKVNHHPTPSESVPSMDSNQLKPKPKENEWKIVQPKRQRQQAETSKSEQQKGADRGKPNDGNGPFRRSVLRVPRAKSLSKMQEYRSSSRLGRGNPKSTERMEIGTDDLKPARTDSSVSSEAGEATFDSDGL